MLDIRTGTEEDIEERVSQLLILGNPARIQRALRREFKSIHAFLKEHQNIETREELIEEINRNFLHFLKRLFPVWVDAMQYDNLGLYLGSVMVDRIHELYCSSQDLKFSAPKDEPEGKIDNLWVQSRIMDIVYCLGGFAVLKNSPEFARLLVDKSTPFYLNHEHESWFLYVATQLLRPKRLELRTMCVPAFVFAEKDQYILEAFEDKNKLQTSLCQFDFFQCLCTLLKTDKEDTFYPSFSVFSSEKDRIEPLVKRIIDPHERDRWISEVSDKDCATAIFRIDNVAARRHGSSSDWDVGIWCNSGIDKFIRENRQKSGE